MTIHRRAQIPARALSALPITAGGRLRLRCALSVFLAYRQLRQDFDVIEVPDWRAEGLLLTLWAQTPIAGQLHTHVGIVARLVGRQAGVYSRVADWLERCAMRRVDLLAASSRLLADDVMRSGWAGPRAVRVIPYPVDTWRWNSVSSAEHTDPVVLAVGKVEPIKGADVLVEAIGLVAKRMPAVRAVFVGKFSGERDGTPFGDWLKALASRLRVPCEFVGKVPREGLPRWYSQARVVAVASRWDSGPFVGLEAMASARPVVCTRRTGVAELLPEGAGTVVCPSDPAALAHGLEPYLQDARYAQICGMNARAAVTHIASPARIAQMRESFYREAMAAWGRTRSR